MYSDQRQGGPDVLRSETRRPGCTEIRDKEAGMYSDQRHTEPSGYSTVDQKSRVESHLLLPR